MHAAAVIPARYGSTRFPGKPLAPILGRPMIAWVVEAARRARRIDAVWVATDHEAIARAARDAGADVALTSRACTSGTDRVAEAAEGIDAAVIVNVQGDEPLLEPGDLDALVAAFDGEEPQMATLARPASGPGELVDPGAVKVVCTRAGDALYFSRSPIPYYREAWRTRPGPVPEGFVEPRIHLGIYGFTRKALLAFPRLPAGGLERAECLEQLRALEAGWKIRVLPARSVSVGVDRPEDVGRVEEVLRNRSRGASV